MARQPRSPRLGLSQAMLYLSHPSSLEHDPRAQVPAHPDTPERLLAVERLLGERDWLGCERREAPAATESELELIHSARQVEKIRELCLSGGGAIDARHLRRRGLLPRRPARGGRRLRDGAGAARRRGPGRLLRPAALRPPRRTDAGDGLLPLQQRRGRGRAGDPRARRRAGPDPRLGRPPRQRHRRGLPPASRRPLHQHPPGRDLSRQRAPRATSAPGAARGTRSTCRFRPAPRRSSGSRCSSTS